mmetsp:Transcript_10325/g.13971  ORF Transcript_10325/g.13971 Transcript_10325/m.13971 type:complete len:249 (-) Transcript_10325:41-787(-)
MLELIDVASKSLPNMFCITKALSGVRDLCLDGACEETLNNFTHSEESKVDVGALHGFKVVHLLVFLVINLIEELLPMIIEVVEEFFVLHHLRFTVKNHCGCLTEVLACFDPAGLTVIVKTLTGVLIDINAVNNKVFGSLHQDLLGVEEGLSHALNLFVVVMVDLATVVQHVANVRDRETHLSDGHRDLLESSVPETAHGVLKMLLHRVVLADAMRQVRHAMEIESTNEETFDQARDSLILMLVNSHRY